MSSKLLYVRRTYATLLRFCAQYMSIQIAFNPCRLQKNISKPVSINGMYARLMPHYGSLVAAKTAEHLETRSLHKCFCRATPLCQTNILCPGKWPLRHHYLQNFFNLGGFKPCSMNVDTTRRAISQLMAFCRSSANPPIRSMPCWRSFENLVHLSALDMHVVCATHTRHQKHSASTPMWRALFL